MTTGLLGFDGCGDGDPNLAGWDGYNFTNPGNGVYGGKCIKVYGSGGHAEWPVAATVNPGFGFHAYRYYSDNPKLGPVARLREGSTTHVSVYFTHEGDVAVYGPGGLLGSVWPGSTGLPPQETGFFSYRKWHHVQLEAVIHDTAGQVRVWLWGILALELTAVNTRNGGSGVVDNIQFSGPDGNEIWVDNLWAVDMTVPGAAMLGPGLVTTRRPVADAGGEWVPSTAPGDPHFARVDDPEPWAYGGTDRAFLTTEYLSTDLDGAVEQLVVGEDGMTAAGATPLGVRVIGQLARVGATPADGRLLLFDGDGAGVGAGPTVALDTTPVVQMDVYPERPGSAGAWTAASVDGLLIGAEKLG